MLKPATLLFILLSVAANAQLGFCEGSKGNPVFYENFGSGSNFGPALAAGTTTYNYISGWPDDGQYTLSSNINLIPTWHVAEDHTFNEAVNGVNGYALIVNASVTPGEFYSRTVTGLCVNTTFEFSAYIMNIYNSGTNACSGTGIPVDVTFEIWNLAGTILLRSGSTGAVEGKPTPIWKQFALLFTTTTETGVILKMRNNGAGGCGNDIAIDDIAFRSCGDFATIITTATSGNRYIVCENETPVNLPLNIQITGNNATVYQWQKSADGNIWMDITGANSLNYQASGVTETTLYRAKIAQDATNLSNPFCFTIAENFTIIVLPRPLPPNSSGNKTVCANDPIPILTVVANHDFSYNWYESAEGGNLLSAGSASFLPTSAGSFYVESFVPTINCASQARTKITLMINPSPPSFDSTKSFCEDDSVELIASNSDEYSWSTGETTRSIFVSEASVFSVTVKNEFLCTAQQTFTVKRYLKPAVPTFSITDDTVVFLNSVDGEFEFSIDGVNYQSSPIFYDVSGGQHTRSIREIHGCGNSENEFFVINVPKYFSPNNDGFNDFFFIKDLHALQNPIIYIFDRYGKLLKQLTVSDPTWDGKYNGQILPSDDYWYRMTYGRDKILRGHFSIKR